MEAQSLDFHTGSLIIQVLLKWMIHDIFRSNSRIFFISDLELMQRIRKVRRPKIKAIPESNLVTIVCRNFKRFSLTGLLLKIKNFSSCDDGSPPENTEFKVFWATGENSPE